jgi:hypothetical protein
VVRQSRDRNGGNGIRWPGDAEFLGAVVGGVIGFFVEFVIAAIEGAADHHVVVPAPVPPTDH